MGIRSAFLRANILECLHIHRLEDAGQRVVRPGPHETGDRRLLHRDAVVLRSEDRNLIIDTMMKQFGDEIRSHLVAPAAHLLAPVRSERRDPDIQPQPVRAETRLLVFFRKKRHDDVVEVICGSGEYGSESILPIVAVADFIDGAEALTDDGANFIPDGRAAKLRELAGEYEIDGERHLHQLSLRRRCFGCRLRHPHSPRQTSQPIMRNGSAHAGSFT